MLNQEYCSSINIFWYFQLKVQNLDVRYFYLSNYYEEKKSTKSSSYVYFLKKSNCPNQLGVGGTINFPLPKTKNKKY